MCVYVCMRMYLYMYACMDGCMYVCSDRKPQKGPGEPRIGPGEPKKSPGEPRRARKWPKSGPEEPRRAQERPRRAQERPRRSPGEAQEKPRRAQNKPGLAQNSPYAHSKPEEVPKSLRVRMRARSITTQPVHTATNSKQERNQKARMGACARARLEREQRTLQNIGGAEKTTRAHARALISTQLLKQPND